MRPITVSVPAGGNVIVPLDQYLTPEQVVWGVSGAGTVTATGQIGPMGTFDAAGFPVGGTYSVALGAPVPDNQYYTPGYDPGSVTASTTAAPTGYLDVGTITSPLTGGAYSAIKFANAGGSAVTVIVNQAGVR